MMQWTPVEAAARAAQDTDFLLIDVREPEEFAFCRLEGAQLLPLSQMSQWEADLAASGRPLLIYCHHGVRSARVCARLAALGHEQAINLAGGIDRWSIEVDESIPRY